MSLSDTTGAFPGTPTHGAGDELALQLARRRAANMEEQGISNGPPFLTPVTAANAAAGDKAELEMLRSQLEASITEIKSVQTRSLELEEALSRAEEQKALTPASREVHDRIRTLRTHQCWHNITKIYK